MASIVAGLKDATNPFVRLIVNATSEDGNANVPFYQMEEIRDTSFQSDNACETIHRALIQRLEWASHGAPMVLSKTLCVIRLLMLEGPAGFNHRMGMASGKLLQIINESNDVRRGTVEERNRDLAQAIHQAISGDSKPLVRFGQDQAQPQGSHTAVTAGGKPLTYKSDYQAQQEKEQKMYKKRLEESQSKSALVVSDRLLETFDGSLAPQKLVDSAVNSPKKKFVKEELESFVAAALHTEKIRDVCTAIDAVLRDGRASLQNRFKALTLAEALVMHPVNDAQLFFKQHALGINRHLSIERVDNPMKAEAARSIAQAIASTVQNAMPILTIPQVNNQRPRGASAVGSSGPAAAALVAGMGGAVPPAMQGAAPTSSSSSSFQFAAQPQQPVQQQQQQQQQWQWNGPNQAPTTAQSIDDLFSNLSVKTPVTAKQPPLQQQPQPQLQQRLSQPPAFSGSNSNWTFDSLQGGAFSTFGGVQQQQQQSLMTSPPSTLLVSPQMTSVPNNSMVANNTRGGGVPTGSFAQLPAALSPAPAVAAAQPAAASSTQQQDLIRKQMEELQRNMAMMMQAVMMQQQQPKQSQPEPQQQQQQPPAAPPQPPQTSALEYQQQQQHHHLEASEETNNGHYSPQVSHAHADAAAASSEAGNNHSNSCSRSTSLNASSHQQTLPPAGGDDDSAATEYLSVHEAHHHHENQQPLPAVAAPISVVPPAASVQAQQLQPQVTVNMLMQLQEQMMATQQMLQQQQAAFQLLQAQLLSQQQQQQQQLPQ